MAILAAVIAAALAGVVAWQHRRQQHTIDRLQTALRNSGDEGIPPGTLEDALDRVESALMDEDSELEERRNAAAFELLSTGAIVADADGLVVLRNRAAQPFAGARHGNALVENVIRSRLQDALRGEYTDEELRLHGPPERVLLVVGSPLIDEGELVGAVVLIDDVSEQQRLDAVRRDFVANVSHELRTPVGALSLLAETLEDEDDPEVLKSFLARIQDESNRLSNLVDALLDLSRIEAGFGGEGSEVALEGVVRESIAAVRAAADHRDVELQLELTEVPPIEGDHDQLVSAVTNLLSNGVKYTGAGGTVSARLVSHGGEVAVVVNDTGVGIPQKDMNRVFERFYRVDRGRAATTGGTGLGLSIVRHVAVNHGGRVELVSQEGVGSTFSMILPLPSDTAVGDERGGAQIIDSKVGDMDE